MAASIFVTSNFCSVTRSWTRRHQDRGRAQEVSAMEMHQAEVEQPPEQRVWMIGLLGDPHRGFSMPDSLVVTAEDGKHAGKHVLRHCRLDHERSEALSAQLAVESDVQLEQFGCFAVLGQGV